MSTFDYGKIKEIQPFENTDWAGYIIVTENSQIRVAIDNHGECCEEFGKKLHHSLEKPEDFIGADVNYVKWGKDKTVSENPDYHSAVVHIETSKGLLEVEVYNYHNGYYPHEVQVEWHGYKDTQSL